jgi:hypothetical protein
MGEEPFFGGIQGPTCVPSINANTKDSAISRIFADGGNTYYQEKNIRSKY